MALNGSRLTGTLYTDILAQLQSLFPVNVSLLAQEQADYNTGQQNLAHAIANAAGPDVVTEITGNAVVTGVQTGGGTAVVT